MPIKIETLDFRQSNFLVMMVHCNELDIFQTRREDRTKQESVLKEFYL